MKTTLALAFLAFVAGCGDNFEGDQSLGSTDECGAPTMSPATDTCNARGFAYVDYGCYPVSGCECLGDCDRLYASEGECAGACLDGLPCNSDGGCVNQGTCVEGTCRYPWAER
jgi:hypothetical protein